MLDTEQLEDLSMHFPTINESGGGTLLTSEIQAALKVVGIDIPGYQLRDILGRFGDISQLSFDQFTSLYEELYEAKTEETKRWKKRIGSVARSYQVQSITEHGADEIVHTIRVEEEVAFSNWINNNLSVDEELRQYLPVKPEGGDLYKKVQDGLIICKLINLAIPETIDERMMNKKNLNTYMKLENLTLSLMSAQAIGCNIVNIDADDLSKGKPHLVLGLLWQIIRIGLFNQIDLVHVPGLFHLLHEGETLDDLRHLLPEEILIRWVNYHLEKSRVDRRLTNFTSDITDSVIYTHLIHQIAPSGARVTLAPLHVNVHDKRQRANTMLNEAEKVECREFVTANDVVSGNYNLNLAFVANLFNKHPNLPGADKIVDEYSIPKLPRRNIDLSDRHGFTHEYERVESNSRKPFRDLAGRSHQSPFREIYPTHEVEPSYSTTQLSYISPPTTNQVGVIPTISNQVETSSQSNSPELIAYMFKNLTLDLITLPTNFPFNLSDFDVVEDISITGQHEVKKCKHKQTGLYVAIKAVAIPKGRTINQESLQKVLKQLKNEIELQQNIKSENIVKLYGTGIQNGKLHLCMELMDFSLYEFYHMVHKQNIEIKQPTFPEILLALIAINILNALDDLKAKSNIMHRDVKPQNILLHQSGSIKLCDLGVSRQLEDSLATTTVGTWLYIAPEMIRGSENNYSIKSDVWSLGMTLLEAVYGKYPVTQDFMNDNGPVRMIQLANIISSTNWAEKVQECMAYHSDEAKGFIWLCLEKVENRPKFSELKQLAFYKQNSKFNNSSRIAKCIKEAIE